MTAVRVATFAGPGASPVIREVPRPEVPRKAALIQIGACGVCGTDLHILKGHWPKPLPWPFTLGHELAGVIVEIGPELTHDWSGQPLAVGSKVMLPPLMPCGTCYWCTHYPETANKCLTPVYYGRYLGFEKPPHLWGGFAEMVYVDLEELPGTKIYRLPDDMPLRLGALSEPLTSCIRALSRAQRIGGFRVGDTVVIQGSGPIGVLAVAAAREMGAGRVIVVGAPEQPRLALCRRFGAEATVNTYVEMGQFTDAGAILTNWHRICTKDLNLLGSWAFTANDLPQGVAMLDRARDRYPWYEMQTLFPFTEAGLADAIDAAIAMRTVKSTIVPFEGLG
ncbi:MAG: tdh [Geminicoccaceae bacterium]|nr:tdh [Geminicoccaceae bacterium]